MTTLQRASANWTVHFVDKFVIVVFVIIVNFTYSNKY